MFTRMRQKLRGAWVQRTETGTAYKKLVEVEEDDAEEGAALSVGKKLMLGALLWGAEAGNNITQRNLLHVLQLLGMPLSMTSLTSGISGFCAVLLLSWVGWLADRGTCPQRRKVAATLLLSGVLVSGVSCILMATLIHLKNLQDSAVVHDATNASSVVMNETGVLSHCGNETGSSVVDPERFATLEVQLWNRTDNDSQALRPLSKVPFKAGLAMLGFILVDVGYDGTCSFAKSYMVTCCPVSERASLLVLCVIMASAGGLFSSVLGMLDLTSFPGLPPLDGYAGTAKVVVETVSVLACIAVGLPITLLTGWSVRRHTHPSGTVHHDDDDDDDADGDDDHASETVHTHRRQQDPDHLSETMESDLYLLNGIESTYGGSMAHSEEKKSDDGISCFTQDGAGEKPFRKGNDVSLCDVLEDVIFGNMSTPAPTTGTQHIAEESKSLDGDMSTPALTTGTQHIVEESKSLQFHEKERISLEILSLSKPNLPGKVLGIDDEAETHLDRDGKLCSPFSIPEYRMVSHRNTTPLETVDSSRSSEVSEPKEIQTEDTRAERKLPRGVKGRIALIVVSTAFTTGMSLMFSVGISDYMAKAIYQGKPGADADTETHARYEEGLKMASKGFCIHYASFLLFNFANPYLIKSLGCRMEFLMAQILTAGTMAVLALTARLEVVFVLALVAGFHRMTLLVLPYVAATNILCKTADPEGERLGFVISLVSAAISLGNCVFFVWLGPLENLTGLASIPLWMGVFYGCMSAFTFLFVGHVD